MVLPNRLFFFLRQNERTGTFLSIQNVRTGTFIKQGTPQALFGAAENPDKEGGNDDRGVGSGIRVESMPWPRHLI
jgi:hypothetical protein